MHAPSLSHVRFFETLWTVACQAPVSMGFSGEEYWSGLSFPPLEDLSDPVFEPPFPVSTTQADGFFTTESTGNPICFHSIVQNKINIKLYRKFKHIKGRSERFNICNNRNFTSNVRILQRIEIMEEEKTSNS